MLSELPTAVQSTLLAIAVAALSALSTVVIAYINVLKNKALKAAQNLEQDTNQKKLNSAVSNLEHISETVVMSIEQEEKQQIIAMLADNQIDKEELHKLRQIAVSRIISQLTEDTKNLLSSAFGNLEDYVADLVSRIVLELKLTNTNK